MEATCVVTCRRSRGLVGIGHHHLPSLFRSLRDSFFSEIVVQTDDS